jgi:hypothetical protein
LELFVSSNFEISAPPYSTRHTPDGKGDVLHIVVHENVRLSEVIVTDFLGSDRLPIKFSILDPVRRREALDPVENSTDWEQFQSLTSELISSNIEIHSSNKADKDTHNFAASIASAYRISTRKTTILDRKYEISSLNRLLEHERKLRKLWQETMDPDCKTAIN